MLELKEICELTGIDQSVLERAFSFRTVEAKQEKVSTTLNVAQVKRTPEFKGKNCLKWQFILHDLNHDCPNKSYN